MTRFTHHLMPDLSIPQKSLLIICKKYTKKAGGKHCSCLHSSDNVFAFIYCVFLRSVAGYGNLSPVSANLGNQERQHFMEIADDPVIGHIKYERPGILVDRDDTLGVSHSDNVLDGA